MDDFIDFFSDIDPLKQSTITVDSGNDDNSFVIPDDCILNVEYVDGKKEGPATVRTKKGILFAKLCYENDKLNGYCIFNDYTGKKSFEGYYENNVRDGWGCEYDEKHQPIFTGLYRNGERYCEMKPVPKMKDYYQEIVDGRQIAIAKYTKEYRRTGNCYIFENETIARLSVFQEGLEMRTIKEFKDGIMKEYNGQGSLLYEGGYKDDLLNNYPRHGEGDEYIDDCIVYSGNWMNNQRCGMGNSYKDGNLYYSGQWKSGAPQGMGEIVNEDGDVIYKGSWSCGYLVVKNNKRVNYKTGLEEPMPPQQPKKKKAEEKEAASAEKKAPESQPADKQKEPNKTAKPTEAKKAKGPQPAASPKVETEPKNKKEKAPAPTANGGKVRKGSNPPVPKKEIQVNGVNENTPNTAEPKKSKLNLTPKTSTKKQKNTSPVPDPNQPTPHKQNTPSPAPVVRRSSSKEKKENPQPTPQKKNTPSPVVGNNTVESTEKSPVEKTGKKKSKKSKKTNKEAGDILNNTLSPFMQAISQRIEQSVIFVEDSD